MKMQLQNSSTEPPVELGASLASLMNAVDANAVLQGSSPSGIAAHFMARGIILALTNQWSAMQVLEVLHAMMADYITSPDVCNLELNTIVPLIQASGGHEKYREQ